MIIAIDGPAGSGKSTVAQLIASRLHFKYIETGSMYRAVAWKAQQMGIDPEDAERIAEVARTISIEFQPGNERQKVVVDGKDLTADLKTETIGRLAAIVAANKTVREVMVAQQQNMGRNGNVVMDGRDIGTVVFPDADKKFFMVADQKERAQRRHEEIRVKSPEVTFEKIYEQLQQRDFEDENREVSPLVPAKDSIRLDTTQMSIDDVVAHMIEIIGPVHSQ
ncbi:MAG: (d)CMP kinase [Nitrospinota bacterium]|nr:(d)CMP kinase [Nitrospinota bacterium]